MLSKAIASAFSASCVFRTNRFSPHSIEQKGQVTAVKRNCHALGILTGLSLISFTLAGCTPPKVETTSSTKIPVPQSPPCTNQNLSTEAIFSGSKAGVAVVETSDGLGSAFVVRHQDGVTLLVTNAHVVEGSQVATLKWPDGSQDNAAVVATGGGNSPETDLALLEVRAIRGKVLQIKPEAVNVGTDIIAIGAPKGLEFSISRGIVSGLRDDGAILQIDAAINPGNSGGPVLDGTGCVVGMATFKLRDSEGLNFALAASTINAFLAKPPSPPSRLETTQSPDDASEGAANDSARRPEEASGRSTSGPTCWFQLSQDSTDLEPSRCSVTTRRNVNGHLVYDVIEPNGTTRTVVLWNDDSAEVILQGKRYLGRWNKDQDGDFQVHLDQGTFAFRY